MTSDPQIPAGRLVEFVAATFVAAGVMDAHATTTAQRLVEADLRGRTGHGVIRVSAYLKRIRSGAINLRPEIQIRSEGPASALVDGDNGLGQVVVTRATELAIEKAQASGVALVGTVQSNHAGAGGVYTAMVLARGMVALYFAVASGNGLTPWGGRERLLGTNPIAAAFPAGTEVPFQLDIATTVTSHGSISVKEQAGEPLPEGWVVDREGNPITDPALADEGYLVPIGGHKGSGLNLMVGVMAGIMTGAAFGRDVVSFRVNATTPTNTGQAILVMRPDLFRPLEEYSTEMDRQLRDLRTSESMSDQPVRLPGERAAQLQDERVNNGIPVPVRLVELLNVEASALGLDDRLVY